MVILAFLLALYRNLKVQIFTSVTKDNYLKFQEKTLGQKMPLGQRDIFALFQIFIADDLLHHFSPLYQPRHHLILHQFAEGH